jgi:hypothetical protein
MVTLALATAGAGAFAQGPPPAAQAPARSPRASAAIDLTGYWVAIVNEDWRWRMMTAPKGDLTSVPVNAEGRRVAGQWDPATDGSCLAYGAAGLMRMPTRLHITWEDDATLKIESDAGRQTRLLRFGAAPLPAARSLQGHSVAEWERTLGPYRGMFGRGFGPPPAGGSLKVVTTHLSAGWLRRNGVPYSEDAVMTEYFDRFPAPDGSEWFMVTSSVADPKYLTMPFVTSSHFRREPDGSKWSPTPCKAAA